MISKNVTQKVLFSPIEKGADTLLVISGYATPNMASWLIKSVQERKLRPINIRLIVGMTPYDGLSISVHEGFKELHTGRFTNLSKFSCSYVYENPPVHTNLYIWMKDNAPIEAFTGSIEFLQSAFVSGRRELAIECNAEEAYMYFQEIEAQSIYCNHSEVEDYIVLTKKHNFLDEENSNQIIMSGKGVIYTTLSLLSRNGETGMKSGLNWGNRNRRNRNEAYIPLPSSIAKTNFFPLEKQHFVAKTDDGHTLILRVEQENNKAITTPLSNAQLGEYFRGRLGLPNSAYISRKDLLSYGRTDVTFYKIDDEEFYMDFSVHKET